MAERKTKESRNPGMDHQHYGYSAISSRRPLQWPNKAAVAVSIVLYLESWELSAPEGAVRDPRLVGANGGGYAPETRAWSYREYGNRVGIFRIFELLDRVGLPFSVAANADAVHRYPNLTAACLERSAEFVAHGTHASRMISSRMDEAQERDYIAASIDAIEAASGERPRGWVGQDYGESVRTPVLLAEAGIEFVMDWPNDDQPYFLTVDPPVVSIPAQPMFDDVQSLWLSAMAPARFPLNVAEAIDQFVKESGRSLVIGIHPWVFGRAHLIRYLEETLTALKHRKRIWPCQLGEMASYFRAHQPKDQFDV